MFHATFNSSRLIWEKILLRVFQNSAMKKARAARTLGETRRTAIPRQKMPLGGLAAAFSSLAGRKHDYGASRGASESQKKLEKERRSAKSDRKAPNGAPNAMLDPCSEAPYRRFLPSCEQNRATAASLQKKKPAKRYEHLAGIQGHRARRPLDFTRCRPTSSRRSKWPNRRTRPRHRHRFSSRVRNHGHSKGLREAPQQTINALQPPPSSLSNRASSAASPRAQGRFAREPQAHGT